MPCEYGGDRGEREGFSFHSATKGRRSCPQGLPPPPLLCFSFPRSTTIYFSPPSYCHHCFRISKFRSSSCDVELSRVPQGMEICLSYFPVNLDYSNRQKRLLDDYDFACDCDRCKVEADWSDNENVDEEEEEEVMEEDEDDQDQQMVASDAENGGDADFPHAYFFLRYMCNQNDCWGTLAPLTSTIMEFNVCGSLKNDSIEGEDTLSASMDD